MTREEFSTHILPLKNKLFSFALSILGNREDARDIVQDVMLKIWDESKPLAEYRNVEAWCMTMTRNRSLDKLKRKDRYQEDVTAMQGLNGHDLHPDTQLEQKEMLSKVRELIQKLPVRQREIMELRDFQEHSYEEIAEILSIDINQVKVYLHRARKFIQQELTVIMDYRVQSKTGT